VHPEQRHRPAGTSCRQADGLPTTRCRMPRGRLFEAAPGTPPTSGGRVRVTP